MAVSLILVTILAGDGFPRTPRQKKAAPGLGPEEVREAQVRLEELGYWVGEVDGNWGDNSRHGLIAFQKVEVRPVSGALTPGELQAIRAASRPRPLEGGGPHVEIDVGRQVLFVVDAEGIVIKVYPVSTGDEGRYFDQGKWHRAHTPRGRFTVERKIKGWRRSTLGLLYYPCYFSGGVAIHGSQSVPTYPASHGCVRIPVSAAREFSEVTPLGTEVIVHDGGQGPALTTKK